VVDIRERRSERTRFSQLVQSGSRRQRRVASQLAQAAGMSAQTVANSIRR
jgi:hypothetical protein